MQTPKRTTALIASLVAVIVLLTCAVIFLAVTREPRTVTAETSAPAAPETAPEQTAPQESEAAPTVPQPETTPAQAANAPGLEITDPDFYAREHFWPDNTPQQTVERTEHTLTVSLYDMEGREYRRAVIHLTEDGGYGWKETTLYDPKGNPSEHRVTTVEGLTTDLTTWAYEYDEQDRMTAAICQMSSGETPRTEDRYTYFADGSHDWEQKTYLLQDGAEILWNHFVETRDARGNPLSRETFVEAGVPK